MTNDILAKIRKTTLGRIKSEPIPIQELREKARLARKPHNFIEALHSFPSIIAEIKFSSPSEGAINKGNNPLEIAKEYLLSGASALSVLTEPKFFGGSLEYIQRIRQKYPQAKILMKDFIIHESQLLQGLIHGADAVLLIVALLSTEELTSLYEKTVSLGLTPLVEVHNQAEFKIALNMSANLIGVNNRNLKTLKVDLQVSKDLAKNVSGKITLISESGIKNASTLQELRAYGYHGFLIGTQFMKSPSPGQALQKMIKEASQ